MDHFRILTVTKQALKLVVSRENEITFVHICLGPKVLILSEFITPTNDISLTDCVWPNVDPQI